MAERVVLEKDAIYKIILVESPGQPKTLPTVECRGGTVSLRSTTFPEVPSSINSIPVQIDVADGEIVKTNIGDNMTYLGYTAADSLATVILTCFKVVKL